MNKTFPAINQSTSRIDPAPKVIFFVTEDWFFCSHFLERAVAARKAGYHVAVLTRVNKHAEVILSNGLQLIPLMLERTKINPLGELALIQRLVDLYKKEHPRIVHHVALKPILYGTLAAKIAGVPGIVNAPVGMGYVFSSMQFKARLLKPFILMAYRVLLNPVHSVTVFENPDDMAYFENKGIVNCARTRLIRGSGVNMRQFAPTNEPDGIPIIMLAARMLWDKGIGEFIEAARILQKQSIPARFVLVGAPDTENPESIDVSRLLSWRNEGIIEWWGQQNEMPAVFEKAHIVCLPSYSEGLPRVLIEAAASGKPIVTTDVPGCREIVKAGENGLLIPPKSPQALADALCTLIRDPGLRLRMGKKGRELAVRNFSTEQIVTETLAVYNDLQE